MFGWLWYLMVALQFYFVWALLRCVQYHLRLRREAKGKPSPPARSERHDLEW